MKKFLFTLAALLMAGSLFAGEYFVCEDFEVPQDKLGNGNVNINVKAHFEAYVSAWQIEFFLPEGMNIKGVKKGTDMNLTFLDEFGDETTVAPDITRQGTRLIVAVMVGSYDEDGNLYGVAKWGPGDYDQMMILVVSCDENFAGGEITIEGAFSCGEDSRPEVNDNRTKTKNFTETSVVTVEGGEQPLKDLTGTITIGSVTDEGKVAIGYTGDEDVEILVVVNGVETPIDEDGMIQLNEGRSIIVVTVSAPGYNSLSLTGELEWTKPVEPEQTDMPVINYDEETFTVTVEGNGTVLVYVDGELVTNPFTFEQTDEEVTYVITATAQEEGKTISETAELTVVVPAKEPVQPEKTDDPVINYDEDTFTVTVEGNGTVLVYVDGELVTNPFTFEQGEEDATYVVTATAQEEGKEISETVELIVVVPGTGVEPGPGPEEGYMLILIDQFGNEVPYPLNEGADGDYTTTVTLKYYPWGEFYWDPALTDEQNEANRPDVPFYFMINGQRFGADEVMRETVLGYAMENPLFEGAEDYYCVPVGFSYTLGLAFKDGQYYVYAAISKATGVDEFNADKAVAGVRYYNMAGQEMQEANGMTIVVTTYTDGTTSTAKVMK